MTQSASFHLEQVDDQKLFVRQRGLISPDQQRLLAQRGVLVAGLGGLGSATAEALVRAGVKRIFLVDPGKVDSGDLNRQILYTRFDLGRYKVEVAARRLESLGPRIEIHPILSPITRDTLLPEGIDAVADCLDNFRARFWLDEACQRGKSLLVHAGLNGYFAQLTSIPPSGDLRLKDIFLGVDPSPERTPATCATCMFVSSIQAMEILRYLTEGASALRLNRKLLYVDMLNLSLEQIDLSPTL